MPTSLLVFCVVGEFDMRRIIHKNGKPMDPFVCFCCNGAHTAAPGAAFAVFN
jgi:hypothetical protein